MSLNGREQTGHPVDVASGCVFMKRVDVVVGGRKAVVWTRRYSTALLGLPGGAFGPGWSSPFFASLTRVPEGYSFLTPEGGTALFEDAQGSVDRGQIVRRLGSFEELILDRGEYRVTRWSIASGRVDRYFFPRQAGGQIGPLSRIEDGGGTAVDVYRDDPERARGLRQRLEKRGLALSYDSSRRVIAVSIVPAGGAAASPVVRYAYDGAGMLCAATDALGVADRYEYDPKGRLVKETLADSEQFVFQYDEKGRCVYTSGVDRYDEKTLHYREDIGWTEITNSNGHKAFYHCLPTGQVAARISPMGGVTRTEYDEHGRITRIMDAVGAATRYEYDEQGNCSKVTDPTGRAITMEYNSAHQATTFVDPGGGVSRREFDAAGRLIAMEDAIGRRFRLTYGEDGHLVEIQRPDGVTYRYVRPSGENVIETQESSGRVTRRTLDDAGRIVTLEDALGGKTVYSYNARGDLVGILRADGSTLTAEYDGCGNPVRIADPGGYTTTYRYGRCGRLVEKTDPAGGALRYLWGTEPHQLIGIVNRKGENYGFEHDADGRIIQETGFDGRVTRFEYNAAGNCVALVNGIGETISYKLDPIGRIVGKQFPDGTSAQFEYHALGDFAAIRNAACTVTFERDRLGRVVREAIDGTSIESAFDVAGNRVGVSIRGEFNVSFAFTPGRFATAIKAAGQTWSFERDQEGRDAEYIMAGGVRCLQGWDAASRLTSQRLTGRGKVSVDRAFIYDQTGNLLSLRESPSRTEFEYDRRNCVAAATGAGESRQFEYDVNANIISSRNSGSAAATEFRYESGDRLVAAGAMTCSYDAQGRLTRKFEPGSGECLYFWDAEDQLVGFRNGRGEEWRYAYDAFGRRVKKEGPDGITRFLWDGDVILREHRQPEKPAYWLIDPHSFKPVARIGDGTIQSVLCDQCGAPRELIGSTGELEARLRPSVFGEFGAAGFPVGYQGQWHDPESGLAYNRYRYYDPQAGRYISQDPMRVPGGLNLYRYVINPLMWVDPFGLNTPPSLPDRTILEGHGVTIVHNYGDMSREHADPIHFHVDQPGGETRIKADGTVLPGDRPLSRQAQALLDEDGSISRLRRAEDRITRVIRDTDAEPGGRPFKPGNRGAPEGEDDEEDEEEC